VTICRIGGDEFCVVLERGGLLHAQAVADRVSQIIARGENQRSVSCGIAIADPSIETPSQLLRAADVAQYEQKRSRRGGGRLAAESCGPATQERAETPSHKPRRVRAQRSWRRRRRQANDRSCESNADTTAVTAMTTQSGPCLSNTNQVTFVWRVFWRMKISSSTAAMIAAMTP
jgi:hypothetical protein